MAMWISSLTFNDVGFIYFPLAIPYCGWKEDTVLGDQFVDSAI